MNWHDDCWLGARSRQDAETRLVAPPKLRREDEKSLNEPPN